jgi:hypothetical protein
MKPNDNLTPALKQVTRTAIIDGKQTIVKNILRR